MPGKPARVREALHDGPFEGEDLLLDAMFGDAAAPAPAEHPLQGAPRPATIEPEHYKVVSFSLYVEDIERLEAIVRELKRRGHYKANKSQVIRQALLLLDLDRVPK